jgi:signal transduction histidine kinase
MVVMAISCVLVDLMSPPSRNRGPPSSARGLFLVHPAAYISRRTRQSVSRPMRARQGIRYRPLVRWFERLLEWGRARDPRLVDGLFALAAIALGIGTVLGQDVSDGYRDPNAWAVVLAAATSAPIAIRRTAPLSALILGSALILAHITADFPEGTLPISVLVLTYSVAAWSPLGRAVVGLAAVWAVLLVLLAVDTPGLDTAGTFGNLAFYSVAWCIGYAMRTRRESERGKLREAEERAERERQRTGRILAEERLRIAQELHDVVAHSMSVIAVQAGVGSHVLDAQPEQARAALDAISATSRATLTELRRLLGVLRNDEGARDHAPAPGLADVAKLVEDVRAVGLPVELTVTGDPTTIHPGVELSAYRVVQEALTNVLKHAGPVARVAVRVAHEPGRLSVEVADDGRGAAARVNGDSGGHGLLGMRERVELWGGELAVGPVRGGGYAVRATLPYGEEAPA